MTSVSYGLDVLAEAVIDLGAIAHNTELLLRAAGGAELMTVVKADGFGHGAVPVARTALAGGATWLGVATPGEALDLRAAGIDAPVLLWLYPPDHDFGPVLAAGVDVSVADVSVLKAVAADAVKTGRPASVHLKADTGMSRGGAVPSEWLRLLEAARGLEEDGAVRVTGLWSHLATAEDTTDAGLHEQIRRFADFRRAAQTAGVLAPLIHLANSAATLHLPQTRHDLVRTGIALYGIEPVPGRIFGLSPAMTVRARVVSVSGSLAQIPLGFADGIPWRVAGRASLQLHGVRVPIAGRITMDEVVVDIGDLPVQPGDVAVMLGPGTSGEPTAADWARWADTNPHEILTGIGPRVVRRYLSHSDLAAR
ncbi:alanine racemase [Actinoplanes sp. NPDC051411]|uniref:alanine racemase n=1 Tax=Actinoplanes sp. NPDC051411 TaxID=3155522 RepID=UPI00341F8F43